MAASLSILSNIAQSNREVPRVALIISCLMQDVLHDIKHRTEILQTLIHLIARSPGAVQEYDLQNSILPFLSSRESPVIIILVLRIFESCEMLKLNKLCEQILQRIYNVLRQPRMLYPELIAACVVAVFAIAAELEIGQFLARTGFVNFVAALQPQIEPFPGPMQSISECLGLLREKSKVP
jgi:hypothetical protein